MAALRKPKTVEDFAAEVRALSIPDYVFDRNYEHGLREIPMHPSIIVRDDTIIVHNDNGTQFLDYYGEGHGGYPWIHHVLLTWAEQRKVGFEWRDPGAITCRPLEN